MGPARLVIFAAVLSKVQAFDVRSHELKSFRRVIWSGGKEDEPRSSISSLIPEITLKLAFDSQQAVDDAGGKSFRFTSPESLDLVHRLRACCDAVGVGVGTVLRDDPSLTVRRTPLPPGRSQPWRVVFDRRLRSRDSGLMCDEHRTQVFYQDGLADDALLLASARLSPATKVADPIAPGEAGLLEALRHLRAARGVEHLMIEGGPDLAKQFLNARLVDRAILIHAPVTFARPVPSGIDHAVLAAAGLTPLPAYTLGGGDGGSCDTIRCWTRPGLAWPGGKGVEAWP